MIKNLTQYSLLNLFILLASISTFPSLAQNVNITMDINSKNNSLDIYLTAMGSSYTSGRFDNLTFTISWSASAGFDLGSIIQAPAIAGSYPLAKLGTRTTNGGLDHQIFNYTTGNSFMPGTFVLNNGVKTLFARIDITGFPASLDLCTMSINDNSWSAANGGNYNISIASTNRTGGFGLRSSISTTYTSGSWSPCDISNLRINVIGNSDSVKIASGIYQFNFPGTFPVYNQFEVMPGAALELISGVPTSQIRLRANSSGAYAQLLDPNFQFSEESVEGVRMEQYVGTNMGWRHLGGISHINGATTFNSGGAPMNYGPSGNVFYFDPATFDWTAVPNSSYVPEAHANNGRGLAVFLGGPNFPVSNGIISWTTLTSPVFTSPPTTYTYTGDHNLVQGAAYNGWNLIGNWRTADIDYHVYNDQLPFDGYSVWIPTGAQTGSYSAYSEAGGGTGAAGRYIAPGQAFWVKGTTAHNGADFTISSSDLTLNGSGSGWHNRNKTNLNPTNKGSLYRIRLNVEQLNGAEKDATVIIFPGLYSTEAYEGKYDVFKQENPSPFPNLYTRTTGNDDLAINGFGTFDKDKVIPVFFNSSQMGESYKITYEKADADPSWGDVYLVDHFTGQTHNLSQDGHYIFSNSLLAPEERFQLQFSPSVGLEESDISRIKIFSFEKTVAVSRSEAIGELRVCLYNLAGQKVYEQSFGEEKMVEINTSLPSAFYIVQARDSKGVSQSETIIIK